MRTIILKNHPEHDYVTQYDNLLNDYECQLWIMNNLVGSISFYNEAKKGIKQFNLGGLVEISIDYGEERFDDDFYIAFVDHSLFSRYEDENGSIDDSKLPKLKFSYENFDHVLKLLVHIYETRPTYVIITQTDNGWVDLWCKEELSQEEQHLIDNDTRYARNRRLNNK